MNPPPKSNAPLLSDESPWKNNTNAIWLGSTLSFQRNLEKFKFPGKLSVDKRKQVIAILSREIMTSHELKTPKLLPAEMMSEIEKEFLVEHFLSDQGFHQAEAGDAFMVDQTAEFLAVFNIRDHLQLQWIDTREDLEKTWDRLVKIETGLNQAINFAFSPKFGFLTADSAQCGTAFVVHVFLHLPALILSDRLQELIEKNKEEGIVQTGLQGDPHEMVGEIAAFHNNFTLGVTEENILVALRTLATKLVAEEKSMRQQFKTMQESKVAEIKDQVSRAFAILRHSYQIEALEALQEISLLKLGLDLNWIEGITQATLNRLLFACRRAHLLCLFGQKIQPDELPHKRAEYIHQALQGVTLLI